MLAALASAAVGPPALGAEVAVRPELITPEAEQAIQKGLAHLARTQARNGSWRAQGPMGVYPCAMTALAGLALMAGGNTPSEGEYAENVRRAVYYTLSCANRTGLITVMAEEERPMYGHGFSMLFLAQAYGAEQDVDLQRRIHDVLARAVALTAKSQSGQGGWYYTPDANTDEGSVTVTQIQALRACRNAGIKVPKSTIARACEYIGKCAESDGGISYSVQARGSRPPITAAAVAVLYNAGQYENPVALRALEYTKKQIRSGGATAFGGHGFYGLLYASEAIFLTSAEEWRAFFPKARDDILRRQNKDGSWPGDSVGETYGTALALVILQLPYQYLPILQR